MMQITVDRYRAINQGALKAACTVCLISNDGQPVLDISNVKIMEGREGLFVSMPAEKGRDQKWYPLVWIKHKGLKAGIEAQVLDAYERRLTGEVPSSAPAPTAQSEPAPTGGPACLSD